MAYNQNTIVIRSDGGSTIGMGHIMRCVGLAQQLIKKGFNVVFALAEQSEPVVQRLNFEDIDYQCFMVDIGSRKDSDVTFALCEELEACLLIIDGYEFGEDWLRAVQRPNQVNFLWTDYLQDEKLPVDIILDQTPFSEKKVYLDACPSGVILCGLKYAVLRSEFLDYASIRCERKELKNILITMGGSDPAGATKFVLNALGECDFDVALRVVIGPANSDRDIINMLAKNISDCEVYESVNDMSGIIAWADLAISAAGTSLWEFAYAGLPTLAISIADNQVELASAIEQFGGGINLGDVKVISKNVIVENLNVLIEDLSCLTEMSRNMMMCVDGGGRDRVVDVLLKKVKIDITE